MESDEAYFLIELFMKKCENVRSRCEGNLELVNAAALSYDM